MATDKLAARIAEVTQEAGREGVACGWRACSGCHETNEGAETGFYPYSKTFQSYVGAGCSECGGLGVVWHYWSEADLRAMAQEPSPDPRETTISALEAENKRLREVLEPFKTFAEHAVEQVDDSWVWRTSGKERICDWFGPSDFGAARDLSRNRRETP